MAEHRHIGFLENEGELKKVEQEEFIELVKLFYQIDGFGTYGVSCSAHFDPPDDQGEFLPRIWGHLGFAVIPQKKHIPELLNIIYDAIQKESHAWMSIYGKSGAPEDFQRYNPNIDLKPYSFGTTGSGLYVARLEIRINDNGCLNEIPDYDPDICAPIQAEGNEGTIEKVKQRHKEIKNFWNNLESKIKDYNQRHGFSEMDLMKKEFLPFR